MQKSTIETIPVTGITEIPGSEFVPVSEAKNPESSSEAEQFPVPEVTTTDVVKDTVEVASVPPEIGIGYELGLIGEVTGKGLASDIAREAIDAKIKNNPPVE